jgi:hypothetical protein
VVLETVAAVPGMVCGLLQHLPAIRHIRNDQGLIKELIKEADNERMHLMTFIRIAQPSRFERTLIVVAQAVFYNLYFFLYLLAPKTAHRLVGYLEEEAVISYIHYLEEIDVGRVKNVAAPQIAIKYWKLGSGARLRDVVVVVRADEAQHQPPLCQPNRQRCAFLNTGHSSRKTGVPACNQVTPRVEAAVVDRRFFMGKYSHACFRNGPQRFSDLIA